MYSLLLNQNIRERVTFSWKQHLNFICNRYDVIGPLAIFHEVGNFFYRR